MGKNGKKRSAARWAAVAAALLGATVAGLLAGDPASAVGQRVLHASLSVSKSGSGSGTVRGRPPVGDGIETQLDCGSTCSVQITDTTDPSYVPMTLTAIPDPGSKFEGWSGDCSGNGLTCSMGAIERLASYSVTATFSQIPLAAYPVAVATSGDGRVTSEPAGIDCGATCAATFKTGSTVTLTATPAPGWSFAGWGGACTGKTPCALTITGPKNLTATFRPPSYRLTVGAAGQGSVASDPAGINCGQSCSELFAVGSTVTLTATPDPGAAFVTWDGDCTGPGPACVVPMEQARAVTALFSSATGQPLAVATSGPGVVAGDAGGISCGEACYAVVESGTSITLTASAEAGARLIAWGGACSGRAPTCTLAMSKPRAVVATFAVTQPTYPLAVTTGGKGVVRSSPTGIACKPACTASMTTDAQVTLTAVPAPKWTFVRWDGACTGRTKACRVTMTGPQTVSATFAPNADQRSPRVTALPSSGERGTVVRLRYRVTDDSGRSKEWATIYRGSRKLAVVRGRLDEADPDALFYFLPWKAPDTLPAGALRFCVRATDPTGNTSAPSCAKLRLT